MPDLNGQILGKYQLITRLGRGGMADVYQAYQSTLDRYVALKVLDTRLADESDFVDRFRREAAMVARLRHLNIVQVYDFDVDNELYYMVMELVDGPTLKSELEERHHKKQPFTLAETARIFMALCNAIDYAHARSMIHHDLKPGNIMFTAEGEVVLTDFGLARIVGKAHHTETGSIYGTPAYMAPEQAQGERGDGRSDIYALGVILYEVVTGQLPYEADTPFALVMKHVNEPPLSPTVIKPNLPSEVEAVILKALNKEPDVRYQRAGELARALGEAIGVTAEEAPTTMTITTLGPTAQIEAGVATPALEWSTPTTPPESPYRGLYAFKEKDARFFFGREAFTEQLVTAVQEQPMVAVIGSSGSGKSSVVYAGLIARLRKDWSSGAGEQESIRGGQETEPLPLQTSEAGQSPKSKIDTILRSAQRNPKWIIATFRPGSRPFQALAASLIPLLEPELSETDRLMETRKLAEALDQGELPLYEVVDRILDKGSEGGRMLLVADQFEELYTLGPNVELRHRFLDMLLEVVDIQQFRSNPTFTFVLTLRSDFLTQALTYRPFADALQDTDIKLGPMTRQELGQAIQSPARRQRVMFESGLVARILDDVGDEPGNLPLLEFALTSLWERMKRGRLSHEAYETIGRVEGALARYADEVYEGLNPTEQEETRRIFIQMVRPGQGTEDTRRLATRSELGEADWQVVQRLADTRLAVTGQDPSGQETVEVVHEALIRGWGRLREWMAADRAFRVWQERLRASLNQWEASDQDEGALLRGVPLAEAEDWVAERGTHLSQAELEFIRASLVLQERREAEREQERLTQERLRRRIMQALAAELVIVLVLLLAIGWQWRRADREAVAAVNAQETAIAERMIAERLQTDAERQSRISLAQSLVSLAPLIVEHNNDTELATLLAVEAHNLNQAEQGHLQALVDRTLRDVLGEPYFRTVLRGHDRSISTVAFSPDGQTLASGSGDQTVRLWDLADPGAEPVVLQGHEGGITAVAFSPDGQTLASGSDDQTVRLWDLSASSVEPIVLSSHEDRVTTVAFSPDGQTLASGSLDATVRLWDVANPNATPVVLRSHLLGVTAVAFSPDGQTLASSSLDATVQLWNVSTLLNTGLASPNIEPVILSGYVGWVNDVAFSPDGQTLASGSCGRRDGPDCLQGEIWLWDVANPSASPVVLSGHEDWVNTVAFSPDGRTLASGSNDYSVWLWDLTNPNTDPVILQGHEDRVTTVAFSPDGQTLASSSDDVTVRLWNFADSAIGPVVLHGHKDRVTAVAFSPDGQTLASSSDDATVRLWDISNPNDALIILDNHGIRASTMAFAPDGQTLALGSDDETVQLWDVTDPNTTPLIFRGNEGTVAAVAFSPDGQTLASGSFDSTVRLWDINDPNAVPIVLNGHDDRVTAVAFSPDGQTLASGSFDNTVRLWDVSNSNAAPLIFSGPDDRVTSVAFSPDGQTLASGSFDNTVQLWDVANPNAAPLILHGHEDRVTAIAYSPDGQTLVSGSWDATVRLWDVNDPTAAPVILSGHEESVTSVAYSPDGQTLISGSWDATVRLWNTPNSIVELACQLVRRNLTQEEWKRYLPNEDYRQTCPDLPVPEPGG